MRSIVGVLLQESPGLMIWIATVGSGDLCPDACWHGLGTSLLWVIVTSFVYLPSLLEMSPWIAGLIYQSRAMRCDCGSLIEMMLVLIAIAQGIFVGHGQPGHHHVCLGERNYHARMNLWSL